MAVDSHIAVEGGVVPCVAFGGAALAVGALGKSFLELGEDALRFPAEAEGDVHGVHAEVAHHADFAAGFGVAFPVGGLGGVEVAAVQKAGMDFQHATERVGDFGFTEGIGGCRVLNMLTNNSLL